MNKIIVLLLLFTIGFISCKNSEKEIDRVETVKQYFKVLNNSDYSKISNWFADSIKKVEGEHNNTYSKSEYLRILKWDSVFEPNYEILEVEQKDGIVKAKVSKSDKRIIFFMGKPFITNEILRFKDDKIIAIETEYLNFDEENWGKNRVELLNWTRENHSELNLDHFINIQNESGGKKLLKAIELYKNKK